MFRILIACLCIPVVAMAMSMEEECPKGWSCESSENQKLLLRRGNAVVFLVEAPTGGASIEEVAQQLAARLKGTPPSMENQVARFSVVAEGEDRERMVLVKLVGNGDTFRVVMVRDDPQQEEEIASVISQLMKND